MGVFVARGDGGGRVVRRVLRALEGVSGGL